MAANEQEDVPRETAHHILERLDDILADRDASTAWLARLDSREVADFRKLLHGIRDTLAGLVKERDVLRDGTRGLRTQAGRHADVGDPEREAAGIAAAVVSIRGLLGELAQDCDLFLRRRLARLREASGVATSAGYPEAISEMITCVRDTAHVDPDVWKRAHQKLEALMILKAVAQARYRKSDAARMLRISRPTLDQKIRLFELEDELAAGKADPARHRDLTGGA